MSISTHLFKKFWVMVYNSRQQCHSENSYKQAYAFFIHITYNKIKNKCRHKYECICEYATSKLDVISIFKMEKELDKQ